MKVLPTSVKNELAILGTARIRATTEFFLRMYRDIERFETGWGVTKKLSVPPKLEDFEALEIPEEDRNALRDCKIGDCELKLGEPALEYLRSQVDWNDPGASNGFYLVALNRYRTDLPGGVFGKMARKVAEDSARGSTERYLKATQGAIEKYFRDERGR